jgi:hypothetical protein
MFWFVSPWIPQMFAVCVRAPARDTQEKVRLSKRFNNQKILNLRPQRTWKDSAKVNYVSDKLRNKLD